LPDSLVLVKLDDTTQIILRCSSLIQPVFAYFIYANSMLLINFVNIKSHTGIYC